jgi:BMFP domain-containing protein YqiC
MGSLTKKMSGELSLRQVRQAALNKLDKVLREPPQNDEMCTLQR